MDVLTSETCWALNSWNKKASDIKLVHLYSTIRPCVSVSTTVLAGRRWDGNTTHTVRNWLWILKSFRINSQHSTSTMLHNVLPYTFTLYYSIDNSYLYQSTRDHHHGTQTFWYVPSNSRSMFFYVTFFCILCIYIN